MKNIAFLAFGILLLTSLCVADNPTEDELQVCIKRCQNSGFNVTPSHPTVIIRIQHGYRNVLSVEQI